jgi:cbb3-type cytochrome oxidase maturation protein
VSVLGLMIPATVLLAAVLLGLVIRAVRRGDFDDWEGPAARHFLDDDRAPEQDGDPR